MDKQLTKASYNPVMVTVFGILLVGILGLTDYFTGAELSFSIFYLIPIVLTTWYSGRYSGLVISFFAGATWLYSDLLTHSVYSSVFIPYWNASVRLGFFIITSTMLTSLRKSLKREQEIARTDSLTGAYNSRAFMERAEAELERAHRNNEPFTLAYMDCDNFKTVNDSLGHNVGDTLLCVLVETIKSTVRTYDTVARLGGDEFAILFPEMDAAHGRSALDRINKELLSTMQIYKWPVTFSIGAVTFSSQPASVNEMIKSADSLMYKVKDNGKNNILHQTQ
jgi:diguanylate cyclase (GGDEF)-like protein